MKKFKKVLLTITAVTSLSVGTALVVTNSVKANESTNENTVIRDNLQILQVNNPTNTNLEYTGDLDLNIPESWYKNQKKPVFHIKNRDYDYEAGFKEEDKIFRMYTGHGIHETMILSPEKRDHVWAVRNYWTFGKYEKPRMSQYNTYFQYWGTEYEYATIAYPAPYNPQPDVLDRPLMIDNNNPQPKPEVKPQSPNIEPTVSDYLVVGAGIVIGVGSALLSYFSGWFK